MLGSLIGAAGSLIGGLLGGESSEKGKSHTRTRTRSTTKHRVRLGELVRSAERAGFNPLTVLNAGGLAGFTETRNNSFSNQKTKSSSSSSSGSALGAGIAGALNAVGGAMDTGASRMAESSADAWAGLRTVDNSAARAAEYDLLNAQLGATRYGELGTQPRLPVSTTYDAKPALSANGGLDMAKGGWIDPTFEAPTVTNPFPKVWGASVNPNVPDASAYEERYGGSEIAEMASGAIVGGADLMHNMRAKVDAMRQPGGYLSEPSGLETWWKGSNLWDPPSISSFVQPVVRWQPQPALRMGSGAGW